MLDLGLRGITDGEFRRTYFHIDFLTQLERRRDEGRYRRQLPQRRGQRRLRAAGDAGHGARCGTPSRSSVADFEFLKSVTTRTPKVTIPSPTMLHFRGGRDAISREAYPDLEAFYADVAAGYPDELGSLGAAGCTLRAARRHEPRLSVRREDARRRAPARRRSRRAAAPLRAPDQRRHRRPAQGHDRVRAPVPRQLQERVGGRRRLRAGRRSAVQRARRRRLLPRIRRRALRRLRAAAPRAEGQDRRARPRQHEDRPARVEGRSEASHRRGGEAHSARADVPVAAMRLLEHRARQRHRGRVASGEAAARRSRRRARSGAASERSLSAMPCSRRAPRRVRAAADKPSPSPLAHRRRSPRCSSRPRRARRSRARARVRRARDRRAMRSGCCSTPSENFPAWLAAIRSAQRSILFEIYIVATTRSAASSPTRWRSARAPACTSASSTTGWARPAMRVLADADARRPACDVRVFNPPRLDSPLGWLTRDHRKTITIDGRVGFVSGLCVSARWLGDPAQELEPWRDTGIEIARSGGRRRSSTRSRRCGTCAAIRCRRSSLTPADDDRPGRRRRGCA